LIIAVVGMTLGI